MKKNIIIMALVALTLASCGEKNDTETASYTPPKDLVLESDIMTPEVLWSMNRLGEYAVSPDGKHVVYNLTYFNIAENKSKTDIYIIDIDGNNNRCLTKSFSNELSPTWNKDGSKILFMCADSGDMQVWEMNHLGSGICLLEVVCHRHAVELGLASVTGKHAAGVFPCDGAAGLHLRPAKPAVVAA